MVFNYTRHDDVLIPIRDETIAATRFEPANETQSPAILHYVPYHKDDWHGFGSKYSFFKYLCSNGYEVIAADVVGTGLSSGIKTEPYPPEDGKHAAEIIEWIAEQPWSNGSVGMTGISYGGLTCLRAAAEQPAALDAIVPVHTSGGGFPERYPGGGFPLWMRAGHWAPQMQVLRALPPTRKDDAGRWTEVWETQLECLADTTPWLFKYLEHDSKGEYWNQQEVDLEKIQTPTFLVGGWRDYFITNTIKNYEQIDVDSRLLLGPWRHTLPHKGREEAINFREQVVDWFDRYLKNDQQAASNHEKIEIWTETDGGGKVGQGVWRGLDQWPDVESAANTFSYALTPGGAKRSKNYNETTLNLDYEVDHSVGASAADGLPYFNVPGDPSADDSKSVYFETSPLTAPTELTGTPTANIRLEADYPDPTLSVRLVDVSPSGAANMVTHGERRLPYREGYTDPKELDPGKEYTIELNLRPKSHLFEKGHKLRVVLSGSYFPAMLPSQSHGNITFLSSPDNPSTIEFPGRERLNQTFDEMIEMSDPDPEQPVKSPWVQDSDTDVVIKESRNKDCFSVSAEHYSKIDLPHANHLQMTRKIDTETVPDDPLATVIRGKAKCVFENGTEKVTVISKTRVTHDIAQISTTATLGETMIFDEDWKKFL